jgi:glycosyltransferase involved in cell wall biosynthesis
MRVLAYADSLEFSGAENAFMLLVRGLSAYDGIEVELAAPRGRLVDELSGDPVAVHALPAVPLRAGLSAKDPRLLMRARKFARDGSFDVVLANLPSAESGTVGLVAGPPAVGFLHIPHSLSQANFRLGWCRDQIARPRLKRAARIVVPAPSIQRHVTERWGIAPDLVSWAPEPFRPLEPVARERARAMLGLAEDVLAVGIAGRVSFKQKGHDVLLDAISRLNRAGVKVSLVVAGDGAGSERLRVQAGELGLADRVHLAGYLSNPAVLYCAVDALAIPSRFEGCPLVALEALQLSIPGVASRVDGLGDVWPPEWLVEPGDASALARALNSTLRADREQLRSRVAAHWQKIEPTFGRGTVQRFACVLELATRSNAASVAGRGKHRWRPQRSR